MKYLIIALGLVSASVHANTSKEIINAFPNMSQIQKVSDPHFYINAHAMYNGYDVIGKTVNNIAGGATAGFQVNPYIAYEFYIDASTNESFNLNGNGYKFSHDPAVGLNFQLSTDVRKQYFGYTKIGFEAVKIKIDSTVADESQNERYLNIGLGLGYNVTDSVYTSMEYRQGIANESDFDRNTVIFSVGMRFN